MKKLILFGIILIFIVFIVYKVDSAFQTLEDAFRFEHSLLEPRLSIISDSTSENNKYIYYEYCIDNGGLGYSRTFWSVIINDSNSTDLENGILPVGYKSVGWDSENILLVEKWIPYYSEEIDIELKSGSIFNGVEIKIIDDK